MKYLLALLVSIINYLITYLLGFLVSKYFYNEWQLISINTIFFFIYLFNVIIVFIEWLIFNKFFRYVQYVEQSEYKTIFYLFFFLLPTFFFIGYKLSIGDVHGFNIKNYTQVINYVAVHILFIPVIEELIYRDIMFKILVKNKRNIVLVSIFISFLFMLTHISPDNVDLLYLFYIFLNGMLLFLIRLKKGLLFSIIAHSSINLVVYLFQLKILQYI